MPSKRHHGHPTSIPATSRTLSHQLKYHTADDRWKCKCGYVLGIHGHDRLYAQCPFVGKQLPKPITYPENKITDKRLSAAAEKARKHVAKLKAEGKSVVELFDFALKPRKKKRRKKK